MRDYLIQQAEILPLRIKLSWLRLQRVFNKLHQNFLWFRLFLNTGYCEEGSLLYYLRGVVLLPTWAIVQVGRFAYKDDHPWKYKPPTFKDWIDHATVMTWEFGVILSITIPCSIFLVVTHWGDLT